MNKKNNISHSQVLLILFFLVVVVIGIWMYLAVRKSTSKPTLTEEQKKEIMIGSIQSATEVDLNQKKSMINSIKPSSEATVSSEEKASMVDRIN